jgi:hypothetical protein
VGICGLIIVQIPCRKFPQREIFFNLTLLNDPCARKYASYLGRKNILKIAKQWEFVDWLLYKSPVENFPKAKFFWKPQLFFLYFIEAAAVAL